MYKLYTRYELSRQIERLKRQLSCGKIKSYTQSEIDALSSSCLTIVYNETEEELQFTDGGGNWFTVGLTTIV